MQMLHGNSTQYGPKNANLRIDNASYGYVNLAICTKDGKVLEITVRACELIRDVQAEMYNV